MSRPPDRLHLEGDEPLVGHGDDLLGGLRHDRSIGEGCADERLRADAADLLVRDRRHDHVAAQTLAHGRCADEHARRQRALHVAGTSPVQAPVAHDGRERALHPGDADRIHVRVEEQRAATSAATCNRDDVRSTRHDLGQLDLESCLLEPLGDEGGELGLARRRRGRDPGSSSRSRRAVRSVPPVRRECYAPSAASGAVNPPRPKRESVCSPVQIVTIPCPSSASRTSSRLSGFSSPGEWNS